MENTNTYKRQERAMSDEQKAKISKALSGRKHTDIHNQRIADGQKAAWGKIPYKKNNDLPMDNYLKGGTV